MTENQSRHALALPQPASANWEAIKQELYAARADDRQDGDLEEQQAATDRLTAAHRAFYLSPAPNLQALYERLLENELEEDGTPDLTIEGLELRLEQGELGDLCALGLLRDLRRFATLDAAPSFSRSDDFDPAAWVDAFRAVGGCVRVASPELGGQLWIGRPISCDDEAPAAALCRIVSEDPAKIAAVRAHIGGGASESFDFDDQPCEAGLDKIDAPPGVPADAFAVIVRGDSGNPAFRDGMALVAWGAQKDPAPLIGEECFVRLTDGRTVVKTLESGSAPGLWTLLSVNAAVSALRDVRIEWAAPIQMRFRRVTWGAHIEGAAL